MIDWHSHILPKMDDGSRSVEESNSMLGLMKDQGVTHVIATPHFYANDESVQKFLDRRSASYELLMQSRDVGECPQIICGAEVRYYPGISKLQELDLLTVQGTKILLLEMSISKWTEYTVKELVDIANTRRLRVVLAHIERYVALQNKGTFERLIDHGLLMQSNAGFFKGFGDRHKAMNLLNAGMIHFIGSDAHNLTTRAPNINVAYDLITKKNGQEYVYMMNEFGHKVLGYK